MIVKRNRETSYYSTSGQGLMKFWLIRSTLSVKNRLTPHLQLKKSFRVEALVFAKYPKATRTDSDELCYDGV